jgi:hypothetical protein
MRVTTSQSIKDLNIMVDDLQHTGAKRILVLCDIDNTVLHMTGPGMLGTDQWFRWQLDMIQREVCSPWVVANSLQHLQDITRQLYETEPCEPCEQDTTVETLGLVTDKADLIFLTARCNAMQEVTKKQISSILGPTFRSLPIITCNGQSKSMMSKQLVDGYDAVIFIDDTWHHIEDLVTAYDDGQINGPKHFLAMFYVHEKDKVDAFHDMDKSNVTKEFDAWMKRTSTMSL